MIYLANQTLKGSGSTGPSAPKAASQAPDEGVTGDLDATPAQEIDQKVSNYEEELAPPPKTSKPVIAAVLLILAFGLIMFSGINSVLGTYEMVNGTGETPLEGIVEDGNGDPVKGVEVTIEGTELVAYTNTIGEYEIPNAPAGEQTIKFHKDGHRVIIVHGTLYNQEILDQNNWGANVQDIPDWVPGGTWTGALKGPYIDFNDNPLGTGAVSGVVLDALGQPLSNVNISGAGLWTSSDEAGHFELEDLTPGRYEFSAVNMTDTGPETVRIISFINSYGVEALDFKFDTASVGNVIDKTAGKFGVVTGNVMDEDDEPLQGAKLKLVGSDAELYEDNVIYSGQDGKYEFSNIPIGLYNLTAVAENYYINKSCNLTVEQNSTVTANFILNYISSPRKVTADLTVIYYCMLIFFIIAIIALLGGISAYRRKRYGLAFAGAVLGVIPAVLISTELFICVGAILSVVALLLLVLAKKEFQVPPIE